MKPPCMIVVQSILPPIRASVSRELVEKYGLRKSKVAELMGLTPAAITQYLNMTRGDKLEIIESSDKIMELVSDIAFKIAESESAPDIVILQMCRVCNLIRSQGLICKLHMEEMPQLKLAQPCACSYGLVKPPG